MKFFNRDYSRKTIAHSLLIAMFFNFISPLLSPLLEVKAGDGPAQPEAAQFEPVDTTDLVSTVNGNFNYNMPLLEIPSPAGAAWPLSMSYHAGVNGNSEATWVGLGWTLNPGAINRFVKGYPDDFYNAGLSGHLNVPDQLVSSVYGIGIPLGPMSLNLQFDSFTGNIGANASISLMGALAAVKNKGNANSFIPGFSAGPDISLNMGTSGVGLTFSLGAQYNTGSGQSIGVGINHTVTVGQKPRTNIYGGVSQHAVFKGRSYSSHSLLGVSYSVNDGTASASIAGVGLASNHIQQQGEYTVTTVNKLSALTQLLFPFLSHRETYISLNEYQHHKSFGLLHQLGYLSEVDGKNKYSIRDIWDNDNNVINELESHFNPGFDPNLNFSKNPATAAPEYYYERRMERDIAKNVYQHASSLYSDILTPTADTYQVHAQGIAGVFKPFFKYPFYLYDDYDQSAEKYNTNKYEVINSKLNKGTEISFRFLGEPGANFTPSHTIDSKNYQSVAGSNFQSKKILPAIDLNTGRLKGFKIIDSDGKIYEFFQPVYKVYENSVNIIGRGTNNSRTSENEITTPSAMSWLLTAVKGPDYIDRNNDGLSSDDWGFWVKFNYRSHEHYLEYRTPFADGTYILDPNYVPQMVTDGHGGSAMTFLTNENYSYGLKEQYYVSSVETSSHISFFKTSERDDNIKKSFSSNSAIKITADEIIPTDDGKKTRLRFDLNTKKLDLIDLNASTIKIKYAYKNYYYINRNTVVDHTDGSTSYLYTQKDKKPSGSDIYIRTYTLNSSEKNGIINQNNIDINLDLYEYLEDILSRDINNNPTLIDYYMDYENKIYDGPVTINGTNVGNFKLGGNIQYATLEINPVYKSGVDHKSHHEKLDKIELYKKKFLTGTYKTDYDQAHYQQNEIVKAVKLNYNYDLVQQSDNSLANQSFFNQKGKLTLQSVQVLGEANGSILPPTEFEYYDEYKNHAAYKMYDVNTADYWGGYTSVGTAQLRFNSRDPDQANSDAKAFKLKSITTTLGSKIEIDYESDVIEHVSSANVYAGYYGNAIMSDYKMVTSGQKQTFNIDNGYSLDLLNKLKNYDNRFVLVQVRTFKDYIGLDEFNNPEYDISRTYNHWDLTINQINSSNNTIESVGTYTLSQDASSGDDKIEYRYHVFPKYLFAGGYRVSKISLSGLEDKKTTVYSYGKGVTSVMPGIYIKNLNNTHDMFDLARKHLQNHRMNQEFLAPNVLYQDVEIYDISKLAGNNQPLHGKSKYYYYTALDFEEKSQSQYWHDTETNSHHYVYHHLDRSSIQGKEKAIELMAYNPSNQNYVTRKRTDLFYRFGSDFTDVENNTDPNSRAKNYSDPSVNYSFGPDINNSGPITNSSTFKFSQEFNKYSPAPFNHDLYLGDNTAFEKKNDYGIIYSQYQSSRSDYMRHTVNMAYDNVYSIGMKETTYLYDENFLSAGSNERYSKSLMFDKLSGEMLLSQADDSKGNYLLNMKKPAYWITDYSGMATKNMYKQVAEEKQYIVPQSYTNNLVLVPDSYIQSATAKTWFPWTKAFVGDSEDSYGQVWRQNDIYQWTGNYGTYAAFNNWLGATDNDIIGDWKRSSNITAYDRFSHPIEEKGLDGNYTASIYGHGDALPTAIAKNAQRSEIRYYDFEKTNRNTAVYTNGKIDWAKQRQNAKTGEWAGTIAEATAISVPNLSGKTFLVSYWYYKDAKWTYHEYKETTAANAIQMPAGITGITLIDDIKVHPTGANMSTFTYDPLTWKVSSITDANGNTNYYEYDKLGRLVKVLDQDQYLKSQYEYKYLRNREEAAQ